MRVFILLALLAVLDTTAIAQPADQRARAHFAKGKTLAASGHCTEALVELEAGYQLSRRPVFLFNMGECARVLRNTERARDYYQRYLAAEPNGSLATTARSRLAELAPPPPPPPSQPSLFSPAAPPPVTTVALPAPSVVATQRTDARPAKSESNWKRNTLLAGVGLALVGGAVAVFVATRDPACGPGCIDLR